MARVRHCFFFTSPQNILAQTGENDNNVDDVDDDDEDDGKIKRSRKKQADEMYHKNPCTRTKQSDRVVEAIDSKQEN